MDSYSTILRLLEEDNLSLNDFTDTSVYEPSDSLKDLNSPAYLLFKSGNISVGCVYFNLLYNNLLQRHF